MRALCPTPRDRLLDSQGRPYFLWDSDLTLAEFLEKLRTGPAEVRAYWAGKLLRQAKPDDALQWLSADDIMGMWPQIERHLGRTREFWAWILDAWGRRGCT